MGVRCGLGRVNSVRIGGRGGAGGFTSIELESVNLLTRRTIEQRVVGLLSGRAAEVVLLGAASAGAGGSKHSDLAIATRMLAAMTLSYGLADDELIYLADADDAHRELRRDPAARRQIDETLRRLQARALEIVGRHRTLVSDLADELIRRRFLSAEDIQAILARREVSTELAPHDGGSRIPS
jgi:cell division protease FtsH